ncbi:hypothetical protein PspLS_10450 [Pyricularia sp. CBS 133598]|nr:hypothetical protein PspLS_10450 [Pyricularia sp. CBS 133598]
MSYPFPNGNGGDKKIFGIIMGLLCLAAVLAIAFMVWLYVFRKRKPERDPETGPKSQRKGGGESEGDEPDDGDDPPQEVTQLPPRRPRVPQPVHTADPRVKKSDPKFLRQLPEQFPQLPREVQQQIWDHAEEPNHNKHRDKAQDPCSRQLRMQLWDSLPLKDKEELYEQLDPEIQRRVKQRLRKQRLEEELAEISSDTMTSSFNIAIIVMLSIFAAMIILVGICRVHLLLRFANYGPAPSRARAIDRTCETTAATRTTARSQQTRRQSTLPSYSLQPRAGEIRVSNDEYGTTNDDPQSDVQLSHILRDLEQPPPAYQWSGAGSRPHNQMSEEERRLEVESRAWSRLRRA